MLDFAIAAAGAAGGGGGGGGVVAGGGYPYAPCDCGLGVALLSMPIGRGVPRWCNNCPNKPWNAIRRCQCNRKKARFGWPGQGPASAQWCADCPSRPPDAVNVVDAAAGPPAAPAAQEQQADKPCMCGKGKATLALPIQPKGARWCEECPGKPRNAIPVAGRCVCGRRKATLGAKSDGPAGAKWCEFCPSKPHDAVAVVLPNDEAEKGAASAAPGAGVRRVEGPTVCACGKTTATLALPIQMWLAKWCPDCPQKPRNVVNIASRCECGRRKASMGLPGEGLKWCAICPDRPTAAAAPLVEGAGNGGESCADGLGSQRRVSCVCGRGAATLALPVYAQHGGKWCRDCPDLPRNAVTVVARCECGATKAFMGLPQNFTKGLSGAAWCAECPGKPEEAINFKKRSFASLLE